MFTPPPSPLPSRTHGFNISAPIPIPPTELSNSQNLGHAKRRIGRQILWAVILAPFIVIAFTVCSGFSTRLVQKSSLASSPLSWHVFVSDHSKWKREPTPQTSVSTSLAASSSPTSTASSSVPAASQALPTIPSSPPPLPPSFPQAFDSIITQNFTTSSCLSFFNNMTSSADFRQCRPFSFLYSTSSTFINAQSNLTLMNTLIWGTCNTTLSYNQCQSNMASFASSLQAQCPQELRNQNLLVVNSLTALRAFQVMHDSACLADPTTNTYCYLDAVQNTNPSDLYFYSIPLGIPLPPTTTPSCSACSKTLMGLYSKALQDPSQATLLTGLKSAYQISAQIALQHCGAAFALTTVSAAIALSYSWSTIFIGFISIWILS